MLNFFRLFFLIDQQEFVAAVAEALYVWGIGRQSSHKLKMWGILTALDLRNADDVWLRKKLTVIGLRTAMELRGISCLPLETVHVDKKSAHGAKRVKGQYLLPCKPRITWTDEITGTRHHTERPMSQKINRLIQILWPSG